MEGKTEVAMQAQPTHPKMASCIEEKKDMGNVGVLY